MARITLIVLFLLSCLFLTAKQSDDNAPRPDFEFKEQTHDFGKITKKQSHTFVVTNTGDAPLVLVHIATGCGCTTTEYSKDPIPPGKSGRVVVSYDPATQRPGAFRKSITVYTNSPKKYTRLFVKGEVVKEKKEN